MPKSKKLKGDLKRRYRNRTVKSGLKSAIGELNQAVAGKDASSAKETLGKAARLLDKAATKGVIHANTAARKKSRLARKVNSLQQGSVAESGNQ